jgi:hypothetical protein
MNPLGIGLTIAVTASLAFATNGGGEDKKGGESPLNFLQDTKVSYKPGKGITFDGGDEYSVTIGGRLQPKWYFLNLENAPDTNSFRLRRARSYVKGHIWNRHTTFKLQLEHTAGVDVLDAWGRYSFFNGEDADASLRFGAQKFRAGRQSDTSSGKLELIERSIASRTFADSRATGALVEGSLMKGEHGDRMLSWHVGVMNNDTAAGASSSGANATNAGNNEVDFSFGARFDPMGSLGDEETMFEGDLEHDGTFKASFGANLLIGNDKAGTADNEITTININAAAKSGNGFAGQGEIWLRSDDVQGAGAEADSVGWYVQGSFTTAPSEGPQYGLVGRISMVKLDDANGILGPVGMESGQGNPLAGPGGVSVPGDVLEIQGGVTAYYHKHLLKSQLVYTYQGVDPDAGTSTDNHGLDLMFTLAF